MFSTDLIMFDNSQYTVPEFFGGLSTILHTVVQVNFGTFTCQVCRASGLIVFLYIVKS